jgi:hypothetical protein
MSSYRVTWEIDIEADTPQEAAEKALEIQRRPDSSAVVFEVKGPLCGDGVKFDLWEETE